MGEVKMLFVLRIRDPDTRSSVRGRLANNAFSAVTDNIWELADVGESEDPEMHARYWEEELRWFEDTIDPRTDVIYIWTAADGSLIRSSIGGRRG